MHREKKIQISDLLGKQYIVIGSIENGLDMIARSTRVHVRFVNSVGELHSDVFVPTLGKTSVVTVPVPMGADSATVFFESDIMDYDLRKLVAFVSDAGAAA